MTQQTAVRLPPQRPRVAEIAFSLVIVAGVCALAFAVAMATQIDRVVEERRGELEAQGGSVTEFQEQLVIYVIVVAAIAVVFTAVLVWQAIRFRRGRTGGRFWIVVLTALALAPIVLLTPTTLLTVVVLVAADVLMFLPSVTTWLRATESARSKARLAGIRPA
jgi:uncharacterized membrane protein (UPF0182 family)